MRALVQRVEKASVCVDSEVVGGIGRGLCVFIGVTHNDREAQADQIADKIAGLRVMADSTGMLNLPVSEIGQEVLIVSQFTLYGEVTKGRRPSWAAAASSEHARPLLERVVDRLRDHDLSVVTGRFGEEMRVELVNDGPVTLVIEV